MRTTRRYDGRWRDGAPVVAVVVALVLASGCSAAERDDASKTTASGSDRVTAADRACREKWSDLATRAEQMSRVGVSVRHAFAGRWNAIDAGIDYYAQVATADQCGDLLSARRTTIAATARAAARALPYDAGQREQTAFALRPVYGTLLDSSKGKGRPAEVRQAFSALSKQTPQAADDLAPAYRELARTDPSDTDAVAAAVDDIVLLSRTSDAYQACSAALATISDWRDTLITSPSSSPTP